MVERQVGGEAAQGAQGAIAGPRQGQLRQDPGEVGGWWTQRRVQAPNGRLDQLLDVVQEAGIAVVALGVQGAPPVRVAAPGDQGAVRSLQQHGGGPVPTLVLAPTGGGRHPDQDVAQGLMDQRGRSTE